MLPRIKVFLYQLQDAATPVLQGIIDLDHDIFFFLILILVFVSWILVRALWHFHYKKNPTPQRIVHGTTTATPFSHYFLLFFFMILTFPVAASASSSEEGALPIIPSSPVPSIGSVSSSWIERTYGGTGQEETSSSAPQGVPQDPNGVNPPVQEAMPQQMDEPLAVEVVNPLVPVLEQPLIDDETREYQLFNRLSLHFLIQRLPRNTMDDLVYQQAEVEKRIEAALVDDGIHRQRVHHELNRLRGVLFYPRGSPLSAASLTCYLEQIAQSGTRQSVPYRRVYRAIRNYDLFIDLIFHNNNQ